MARKPKSFLYEHSHVRITTALLGKIMIKTITHQEQYKEFWQTGPQTIKHFKA